MELKLLEILNEFSTIQVQRMGKAAGRMERAQLNMNLDICR